VLPNIKLKISDKTDIVNPNKNILGKIILKNLLLALLLKTAKTDGDTTVIKKIIEPSKIVIKKFIKKIINLFFIII
tara:strand:+ start:362 stop:589 length:228 start_codon:yes stop_codon:yes gene_type:complete